MMEKLLKICNLPQGGGYVPGINLKGQYLNNFGFHPGEFVSLDIKENQIIITRTDATEKISKMAKKNPALSNFD